MLYAGGNVVASGICFCYARLRAMRRTLVLLKEKAEDDDAIKWYKNAKALIEARRKAPHVEWSSKLDSSKHEYDRERSKEKPFHPGAEEMKAKDQISLVSFGRIDRLAPKTGPMTMDGTIGGRMLSSRQHSGAGDQKLTFGKHTGKALKDVPLRWMARKVVGNFGRLARLALEDMGIGISDSEHDGQDDMEEDLVASLKECRTLAVAQEARSKLANHRLKQQLYLHNLLLLAYGRCGAWEEAQDLFQRMATKNKYTWNTMFKVFCDNGRWSEAAETFEAMETGVADAKTCTIMVSYFSDAGHLQRAAAAFAKIEEQDVDAAAWNALISCYARHGDVENTMQCFEQMQGKRTVVAWNALLTAHSQMSGDCEEACKIFMKMPQWDSLSSTAIMIVCGNHEEIDFAEQVFRSMEERDITSWTVAAVAFARSGDFDRADELLKKMPMADVLTWNRTLAVYGSWDVTRAPSMFADMPRRDAVSWTVMVAAFAKNGKLLDAEACLTRAPAWNLQMWNALLAGLSRNGKVEDALKYLLVMNTEGMEPDEISFISILDGFSHGGSLENCVSCFHSMIRDYGIDASDKHYYCMIGTFAKAGRLEEAEELLESVPFVADAPAWRTFISACKLQADGGRAIGALKHASDSVATRMVLQALD